MCEHYNESNARREILLTFAQFLISQNNCNAVTQSQLATAKRKICFEKHHKLIRNILLIG
jgi:hypothetical protein